MSKPLELTVHPKRLVDSGFRRIDADGSWTALHVEEWLIDGTWIRGPFRTHKRLNDAELAAEVFSAVFHEAECEVRARQLGEGHPFFNYWLKANHEYARQAEIVERFATLPHYDEDVTA